MRPALVFVFLSSVMVGCVAGQTNPDVYDSGGVMPPEQAAYDVLFYDLALHVSPADSTIHGTLTATARIHAPVPVFMLDLDPLLGVEGVEDRRTGAALPFTRDGGRLRMAFPYMKQPGDTVMVAVTYGGRPRIAPNPPWSGGFTWARTPGGAPWIATTCQQEGADIWWPVKDHVADEPDSMALHITVPDPLVVASNGRLRRVEPHPDGTRTYHWFVSTSIDTYNVALNIAPYRVLTDSLTSVAGDAFPVVFYVLPEYEEQGRRCWTTFVSTKPSSAPIRSGPTSTARHRRRTWAWSIRPSSPTAQASTTGP